MHFDAVYSERSRGAQCKQKGFAHLFALVGVLIVILVIGEVYYFGKVKSLKIPQTEQNTPIVANPSPKVSNLLQNQETTVLKQPKLTKENTFGIFSNKDLGFEFNYPKESNIKEDSEEEFNKRGNGDFRKNFKGYVGYEPGKFLGAVAVLDKDQNFDNNLISIWVFDNPDNIAIDAWFSKYWYYPFLWGVFDNTSKGHVTPDKEATISGQPAKYKIVSYQPGSPKYLYLSNQGKIYLFRIIGETGDKILSTFKFTN